MAVGRLLRVSCGVEVCRSRFLFLLLDIVGGLQVEQPRAHVSPDIRFITVETQPLAAAFRLFGRRQAAELASRWRPLGSCVCSSSRRWSPSWWKRGARRQASAWWRSRGSRWWRSLHGRRPALERPRQVDGRLDVGRFAHLHVDPDVLREATNKEVCL